MKKKKALVLSRIGGPENRHLPRSAVSDTPRLAAIRFWRNEAIEYKKCGIQTKRQKFKKTAESFGYILFNLLKYHCKSIFQTTGALRATFHSKRVLEN